MVVERLVSSTDKALPRSFEFTSAYQDEAWLVCKLIKSFSPLETAEYFVNICLCNEI